MSSYDILFHAILPSTNEHVQIIINIEIQDNFYPGYPIATRGVYYGARLISSQHGKYFVNSHYENLQKVYSIWICTSPPKSKMNMINRYSIREEHVVGNAEEERSSYDLMTLIMIYLGDDKKTENRVLRLLDILLSESRKSEEIKDTLRNEFEVELTKQSESDEFSVGAKLQLSP